MKKLINDPADVVAESLRGVAKAHPQSLRVDHENRIVYRADAPIEGKVGTVVRRRLGARTPARRIRGPRDARRRLRG